MNELRSILKELREDKGVSMDKMCDDLAKTYGVNLAKSTVSKWENGKAEPTLANARILTKYFNVTLDYIIGLSDNKKEKEQNQSIDTIAAHFDGKKLTPKKMKLIEQYIDALFEDEE
ncbi:MULTISPECIES: helix-turn-helix domain-containing protein [unclassified Clostridium]|jgi:transcriptional regulator with XRE-family HTH domain|uniref:helix-turn-helix domain-containing protein n=1 Tax=unclassified Clostridium TaxID=2614128 RepID=UPI001C0E5C51|nr:helix-turn-helix transcriptional regulator [Clostridium sp. CF012]MBU3145763.1 helix-turn-helix domain-containing protein [Clostridium sp. CF012]